MGWLDSSSQPIFVFMADNEFKNKRCTRCKEYKPATREVFCLDKRAKDGLQPYCRECDKKAKRAIYLSDIAKSRQKLRERYKKNPSRWIENATLWNKSNNERRKEIVQNYHINHPEQSKKDTSVRRARCIKAEGSHTAADIKLAYNLQHGQCFFCFTDLCGKYHVDHLVPLSRGGSNRASNIACACAHCNLSKGSKTAEEFLKHRLIEGLLE